MHEAMEPVCKRGTKLPYTNCQVRIRCVCVCVSYSDRWEGLIVLRKTHVALEILHVVFEVWVCMHV